MGALQPDRCACGGVHLQQVRLQPVWGLQSCAARSMRAGAEEGAPAPTPSRPPHPLAAEGELQHARWRHVGGQPPDAWRRAPPLSEVRRQLAALLQGRILVGHHLRKDLAALGLSHPADATRDTLQYRSVPACLPGGHCLPAVPSGPHMHLRTPPHVPTLLRARPPLVCHHREMQGRRGAGRKLRDLSAEKLGRTIQPAGQRHSPM